MTEKIFVKNAINEYWLPFSGINKDEFIKIQRAVLHGVAMPTPPHLPLIAHTYLVAKTTQVLGNPARLLEIVSQLAATPPEAAEERLIWEECLFLRGFALSRLGRHKEATNTFSSLPARFRSLIQMERGLSSLNRGHFPVAENLFREALSGAQLDPYSLFSLLGGLSLAHIHQGDFRAAEACLRARRQILSSHPAPTLEFGTHLYEILLLLDRNDFSRAAELLGRSLSDIPAATVNGFFLLHLKLRLNLARNELDEAEQTLVTLRSLHTELKLTDGVLDYRLEEIEWNLRADRLHPAIEMIATLEQVAIVNKDDFLLFRVLILKAQASVKNAKTPEALTQIERAIEVGELRHYRPGLSWAFFHAAGIAFATSASERPAEGATLKARLFLNRGRRLAHELRLDVRHAALSYIAEVLDNRYAQASALVSLVKHREIGPELEYFLESYRLLETVTFVVDDGETQFTIAEPHLRRKLFREPGIFWFQKEGILLANPWNQRDLVRVTTVEFPHRSPLLVAFRLFWNDFQSRTQRPHKVGLTLKDIHKTRLSCAYREDLHAAAAKMTISRLRQKLNESDIEIKYNRTEGRYFLATRLPAFTIQSKLEVPLNEATYASREAELLARIAMEPFVSTRSLCQEFSVSRQELHPFLKKLISSRQIRLVRRGPISGYIALKT